MGAGRVRSGTRPGNRCDPAGAPDEAGDAAAPLASVSWRRRAARARRWRLRDAHISIYGFAHVMRRRRRAAARRARSVRVTAARRVVAAADRMFDLPAFALSRHARGGPSQVLSEVIATFGLLSVIWGCTRLRSAAAPFALGAYITAAYWFTASTSFANPAVTIA